MIVMMRVMSDGEGRRYCTMMVKLNALGGSVTVWRVHSFSQAVYKAKVVCSICRADSRTSPWYAWPLYYCGWPHAYIYVHAINITMY